MLSGFLKKKRSTKMYFSLKFLFLAVFYRQGIIVIVFGYGVDKSVSNIIVVFLA